MNELDILEAAHALRRCRRRVCKRVTALHYYHRHSARTNATRRKGLRSRGRTQDLKVMGRYMRTVRSREHKAERERARRVKRCVIRRWERVRTGRASLRRAQDFIGCTWDELKRHIEAQFWPGMSWDNYGARGWHIDHIRPISYFNLNDPIQVKRCFHYTNLQPLWAEINLRKGGWKV